MSMRSQIPVSAADSTLGGEPRPWALQALPPFPAVALQMLGLLDDENASVGRIADLLRIDPALSAEVLRVSNSALYGLSRRVDSVARAVVVLGTEVVKRLALTVAIGRFSHRFLHNPSIRSCWRHSIAAALVAEELAAAMDQPRERSYTAGLLHDVGRLALLACYPAEYSHLLKAAWEDDRDELECERELFDIDHCEAGEWLAKSWSLPEDFVEAIARHQTAEPCDASLVSIIAASHAIADAIGFSVIRQLPQSAVGEIIAQLPIDAPGDLVETLEALPERVRSTIAIVTPHFGLTE